MAIFNRSSVFVFMFYSTIIGKDVFNIYNIEQKDVEDFINKREEEYLQKLDKSNSFKLNKELKQIKSKNITDGKYNLANFFLENFKNNLNKIFKKDKTQYNENVKYQFGNFSNNFVIDVGNGVLFASDIHADAERLKRLWYLFDNLKKEDKVEKLIFLGDYGDRGEYWLYTYFLLSAMTDYYLSNKKQIDIIFIRGNHEDINVAERYCGEKVKKFLSEKKDIFCNIWDKMFLTGIVNILDKRIFCSHGALPVDIRGVLAEKDRYNCFYSNWNDNSFNKTTIEYSPRGAGVLVPVTFTNKIMKENNIDFCIHGHCHENKCAHLENERKLVTVVSNDIYYHYGYPFLGSVYMITQIEDKNLLGKFIQISQQKNKKLFKNKTSLPQCFRSNITQGQNYVECNLKDILGENIN